MRLLRDLILSIIFYSILCVSPFYVFAEQVRGVWVECEGSNETLNTPKKLQDMIDTSYNTGINTIFLQVNRHNRSWYKSRYSDNTPFYAIWNNYKIDPLEYTIKEAHKKGIKVHAWVNMYRIGKTLKSPIIKKLGKGVITKNGSGISMTKYSVNKLPDGGYWLDPGDTDVQEYLLNVVKEVLDKYPDVDGIHLDFIRFPYGGLSPGSRFSNRKDFGYGTESVKRFKKKYGYSPLKMDLSDRRKTEQWDEWRRQQVTDLVIEIYNLCKKKSKNIQVSCAVQPWADRAYMVSFQDWRTWLKQHLVDFIVTMNYTTDRKLAKYLSETVMSFASKQTPAYIGLGAYLFPKSTYTLSKEIQDCQELGAKGIVLFSYDSILKNKAIFNAITKNKWWSK